MHAKNAPFGVPYIFNTFGVTSVVVFLHDWAILKMQSQVEDFGLLL